MKRKVAFLLLFLSFSLICHARQISGCVTDAFTGDPISYVSIGILGGNKGTVSDASGNYYIDPGQEYDGSILRFSCIGYEPLDVVVSEFAARESHNVALVPMSFAIEEVAVKPTKLRKKRFGNTFDTESMVLCTERDKRGFEGGVVINFKSPAFLETVCINVRECTYEQMTFRINIYEVTPDGEFMNILHEPIYSRCGPFRKLTKLEVDVSHYDIVVEGTVMISMEHVEEAEEGYVCFPTGFKGSKSYYKSTSQADWKENEYKVKMPVYVTAQVAK